MQFVTSQRVFRTRFLKTGARLLNVCLESIDGIKLHFFPLLIRTADEGGTHPWCGNCKLLSNYRSLIGLHSSLPVPEFARSAWACVGSLWVLQLPATLNTRRQGELQTWKFVRPMVFLSP